MGLFGGKKQFPELLQNIRKVVDKKLHVDFDEAELIQLSQLVYKYDDKISREVTRLMARALTENSDPAHRLDVLKKAVLELRTAIDRKQKRMEVRQLLIIVENDLKAMLESLDAEIRELQNLRVICTN